MQTKSICILGRQPELGLAELESLFGPEKVHLISNEAALLDIDPCVVPFARLGGSIKLAKLLTVLDTTQWSDLEKFGLETIPEHVQNVPEGKFKLGISAYTLNVSPKRINATALSFKKAIKATGRNVRIIPNNSKQLSSAQVLHNQLTSNTGWELLFIGAGTQTYLAQTIVVQNIDAYAARDQVRPKRDARVGMLPPKLAQIIINLATGKLPPPKIQPETDGICAPPDSGANGQTVLDPFCGTGVILQESLLMGYNAYGTDLEPRMVEYSQTNLDWLTANFKAPNYAVKTGDATNTNWPDGLEIVATETYLGRPFTAVPKPNILNEVISDVNTIHRKFLQNLASQTKKGVRMCIAMPAWKTPNGFKHLQVLDSLEEIGYTRISFVHNPTNNLLYFRPDQIVARELVVLIRK